MTALQNELDDLSSLVADQHAAEVGHLEAIREEQAAAARRQRSASDQHSAHMAQLEEMFHALMDMGRERASTGSGTPLRRRLSERLRELPWLISHDDLTVHEMVGEGGFGQVHRGEYQGAEVAIKSLRSDTTGGSEGRRTLKILFNEAAVMAELRHPHVAEFVGLVMERPHYALVMAFYQSGSLCALLHDDEQELPWWRRLQLAAQVASGMAYLHARSPSCVHGDLKPQNVLLDNGGAARIADFGLAVIRDRSTSASRTVIGGDAGGAMSVAYASPERLQNPDRKPTEAVDVYAFGMLLYELAERKAPWAGVPVMMVAVAVGQGSRPELEAAMPEAVAANYQRLMRDCWAQGATSRPGFAEVARRARELCTQLPPPSGRPGSGGSGGRPHLRRNSSSL